MPVAAESLSGLAPALDDHIHETIGARATGILERMALELGEGYSAEQHSADSEVWQEWEERIIEPLKPVAMDGVNLPISFKEKGQEISAGVALTMALNPSRREVVDTTRRARNQTRGMSRHNNHQGGIALGEGYGAHGEITEVAQTLGFTIGTRKVDDPGRYWPLPIRGKRIAPFVKAEELQDFAESKLRSEWMGSQVVGVVFEVTDKVWGYNTLAKSIVRDPDEPIERLPKDEQALAGQLNPYTNIIQGAVGRALGIIGDKEVLGFARDRTGRQYLENALKIAARKEQRTVKKLRVLSEQVLESVTSSKRFKEEVARAQAL